MRNRFPTPIAVAAVLLALSGVPLPTDAGARSVYVGSDLSSRRALDSLRGRIFCGKPENHFSGKCSNSRYAESAAPTTEVPKENPPPATPEPPSAAVLDPLTVQSVLGREVRSATDENMGRIVDIIVDRLGQVRAAVIDFGGFLGVGSRKIAVDWSILTFGSGEKSDRVVVDLTRAQVKTAPEYKEGKPVVVLGVAPEAPQAADPSQTPR